MSEQLDRIEARVSALCAKAGIVPKMNPAAAKLAQVRSYARTLTKSQVAVEQSLGADLLRILDEDTP